MLRSLAAKKYFAILIAIILLTDLTIFINFRILRQVLAFPCFTIIPGLLILHTLRLNKLAFLKKFVLSVGLSITFLMFVGLFINSFYPLISKPLSLAPILVSFNIILATLAFIAYKRNKNDFNVKDVFNFKVGLKGKLLSPLLFSILFPFMGIFGTYLMNTQENNVVLLVMLFLIPVYVVAITYLKDRIPEVTYPIAILMIGMAIFLMVGLRSNNLASGPADSAEYYIFQVTSNNSHWDSSLIIRPDYNCCLSVTILPTLYKLFLGIGDVYVYKAVFNILCSVIPLTSYLVFRKYMGARYAFLSSFFLTAQHTFISTIGWVGFRQIIALLLFALAVLVFFDDRIVKLQKTMLFVLLMISVIVSHYSTAYIFFILIFLYWFMTNLKSIVLNIAKVEFGNITAGIVVLFFALIFFWYSQVSPTIFNNTTLFIKSNLMNLINLSLEGLKHEETLFTIRGNIGAINNLIYYTSFTFIAIGILRLMKTHRNFDKGYLLMMAISSAILASLSIASLFIVGYGASRVYLQLLIFLAPAFVIGGEVISKFISRFNPKLNLSLAIITIALTAQFFSATYVVYQIAGIHYSEFLNSRGVYLHADSKYS